MDSGVIQYGIFIYSFSAKDMNISTVQIGGRPSRAIFRYGDTLGYAKEYLVVLKAHSLIAQSYI